MAFGLWSAGSGGNGVIRKAQPAPRRRDDEDSADYRSYRRPHYSNGNGGGGDGRANVITSAMVSLGMGVLVLGAGWLGFMRDEIRSALEPMREDIGALQTAHGRLDDKMTGEVLRLNREKADDRVRLEMLADLNRRIEAIEHAVESANEHGHLSLAQINDLRQRIRNLEVRLRMTEEPPP